MPALISALKPDFDVWEDTVRDAVRAGRSFAALHVETHVKVDFFPADDSILDTLQLERRQGHRLPSEPARDIYFATAEDIVLSKLVWYKIGGCVSERQWSDVVGVLKVRGEELDREYLERWALDLEVTQLLRRALEDARAGS